MDGWIVSSCKLAVNHLAFLSSFSKKMRLCLALPTEVGRSPERGDVVVYNNSDVISETYEMGKLQIRTMIAIMAKTMLTDDDVRVSINQSINQLFFIVA